jgi:hypothetical protein
MELGARVHAELLDEQFARLAVDRQRVRLATAAIQRQHQLPAQTFTQWVLRDLQFQLGHELTGAATGEIGVDPGVEHVASSFVQPFGLVARHAFQRKIRERPAAPQGERFAQAVGCLPGRQGARFGGAPLKLDRIERRRSLRDERATGRACGN